ncbi:MAG: GldG family protein [Ruminococcus sp.]|nr:GldG family protein [Ruminococcus sp.]MDE6849682.1 GldG family protein [Ruminococcus sp.]MDE7137260.1 GldG family protein [Ruminococcus sp.]
MSNKEVSKTTETKPKKNLKKFKYGSMSVVVIVLVIVLVIIVNLICSMISKRSPIKIDLTADNRYELSDESVDAIKSLKGDVEITVTFPKSDFASIGAYYQQMYAAYYGINVETPYEMIPSILENYEMYAKQGEGSIKVQYIDMNKDPDIIAKYRDYYNNDIPEGSIIVFSGDENNGRVKVISQEEIIGMIQPANTSTQTSVTMNFVGESTFTSAILNVTDSNPIKTAVVSMMNGASVSGQGYESATSQIMEFLGKNGYDCTEIDIVSDELNPDDYDFVVVPMPSVDFSADIIGKLGDFLYNDGNYQRNMLYIPNLYVADLPNISEFLADWSIQVEEDIILDDTNWINISDLRNLNIKLEISDSDSVGSLPNETLPIVAPASKKLSILTKNNDSVATSVLKSMDTSYDQNNTETGARDVAVISKKETSIGLDTYTSHMLVLGSSFSLDSTILNQTNTFNNANVIIGMLNTMTGKEASAVIPEKALQQALIAPTAHEMNVIKVFAIYVIPAVVAVIGVCVFVRRKNR